MEFLQNLASLVWQKECLVFETKLEIGQKSQSVTNYIQLDVLPCEVDCATLPSDPDYDDRITEFLNEFWVISRMLDSASNFEQYDKPFQLLFSQSVYSLFQKNSQLRRDINLQQV